MSDDTSKHANKRGSSDIARDRIFIERWYIWGYNQLEITRMVNERVREDFEAAQRERKAALTAAANKNDLALYHAIEAQELPNFYTLSRSQIQTDIAAIKKEWRKELDIDLVEWLNKELKRLDYFEHEYLLAWERSKRNRIVATKSDMDKPAELGVDGEEKAAVTRTRKVQRVEYRDGNPAFMQGAERVAADRRRLLGLVSGALGAGDDPRGGGVGGGGGGEPTKLYAGFDISKLERGTRASLQLPADDTGLAKPPAEVKA